ncbi:hypothetical protein J8273_4878 [Carpediemonas membranifera]|uniref:Uncharacterized protein n=1 Tax=Carpediemonas membranifera TaxID=201153 RepID=A0A8J6DZK8_9EUKA|nr:hypothetical protein J8273_4878 [Carpediemonas membranifera]|eukprot:KAG9393759.1 hypothetical protein J8273_4878 [Carpediemonas membranifera]
MGKGNRTRTNRRDAPVQARVSEEEDTFTSNAGLKTMLGDENQQEQACALISAIANSDAATRTLCPDSSHNLLPQLFCLARSTGPVSIAAFDAIQTLAENESTAKLLHANNVSAVLLHAASSLTGPEADTALAAIVAETVELLAVHAPDAVLMLLTPDMVAGLDRVAASVPAALGALGTLSSAAAMIQPVPEELTQAIRTNAMENPTDRVAQAIMAVAEAHASPSVESTCLVIDLGSSDTLWAVMELEYESFDSVLHRVLSFIAQAAQTPRFTPFITHPVVVSRILSLVGIMGTTAPDPEGHAAYPLHCQLVALAPALAAVLAGVADSSMAELTPPLQQTCGMLEQAVLSHASSPDDYFHRSQAGAIGEVLQTLLRAVGGEAVTVYRAQASVQSLLGLVTTSQRLLSAPETVQLGFGGIACSAQLLYTWIDPYNDSPRDQATVEAITAALSAIAPVCADMLRRTTDAECVERAVEVAFTVLSEPVAAEARQQSGVVELMRGARRVIEGGLASSIEGWLAYVQAQ